MKPVRIAVVGLGSIGSWVRQLVTDMPEFELTALVEPDDESRRELASNTSASVFASLDELLEKADAEAIYLSTPSTLHGRQTVACLSSGHHVLTEKPLALSVSEAREGVQAARSGGLTLAVSHQYRTFSWAVTVKKALDSGRIGKPLHAIWYCSNFRSNAYFQVKPWRKQGLKSGSGTLAHQAVHDLDLLHWFFGRSAEVSARLERKLHSVGEHDFVQALIRTEQGCDISFVWTTNHPIGGTRQIFGDYGTIRIDRVRGPSFNVPETIWLEQYRATLRELVQNPSPREQPESASTLLSARPVRRRLKRTLRRLLGRQSSQVSEPGHVKTLRAFAQSIRGEGRPLVGAEDGFAAVALMDAIARSATNNERTKVERL